MARLLAIHGVGWAEFMAHPDIQAQGGSRTEKLARLDAIARTNPETIHGMVSELRGTR